VRLLSRVACEVVDGRVDVSSERLAHSL
jgi:hypothetical protein